MRGKRARTASSSPKYERVIWTEEKTARGSRIMPKVSNSPRTPKIRKRATPQSKKRRLDVPPILPIGSGAADDLFDPPVPVEFKPKHGKVCLCSETSNAADSYLSLACE